MTCKMAKMGFFDPIVYPGVANSAHLHMFFGNTAITPGSTSASLSSSGGGSCIGGTVNRTMQLHLGTGQVRVKTSGTPGETTILCKNSTTT